MSVLRLACGVLALLLVPSLLAGCAVSEDRPGSRATEVYVDLSRHDFQRTPLVRLTGDWLYFPDALVAPEALPAEGGHLVRVPHRWRSPPPANEPAGRALASYALDLVLPPGPEPFGLMLTTVSSAVRLYADGEELARAGVVSADPEVARPGYRPGVFRLPQGVERLQLVAHVSNHHHAQGGLWRPLRVGPLSAVQRQAASEVALTVVFAGAVGVLGLFRLLLWLLNYRDHTALTVALICLLLVLRVLVVDNVYLLRVIEGISWEQLLRLEYLSLAGLAGLGWVYLGQLFPGEFTRLWSVCGTLPCLLFGLAVFLTPVMWFTGVFAYLQAWGVLATVAVLALLVLAVRRGRPAAWAYLASMVVFSALLLHDLLVATLHVAPLVRPAGAIFGLLPFGMALLLVPQTVLLAFRTASSSQELEQRTRELLATRDRLDRYAKDLESRVAGRTAELEAANQRLERLARVDDLTGLGNRRHFDEQLVALWADHRRRVAELGLLMIDVDAFKHFNDTYGHQRGDSTLRAVAEALRRVVNRPLDEVARYGGEEMAVLLPNTGAKDAQIVAERMRAAVQGLNIKHDGSTHGVVTVSIGVASVIPGEAIPHALVEAADAALYEAKLGGRNRVVVASLGADGRPAPSVAEGESRLRDGTR